MTTDFSCYLVLDEALCGARGMAETARLAVEGGAGIVQLRLKDASTEDRVQAGRSVQSAIAQRALFVLNDDVDAAIALGADGIHVGQGDMPPQDVRAKVGPEMMLGLSIETEEQAKRVDPSLVHHIGAGPVRATSTKPGHAAPVGFEGLARIVAASPVPAVAIGGVTAADAAQILRAGAQGLAVVSAICGQPDPRNAAQSIVTALSTTRETTA